MELPVYVPQTQVDCQLTRAPQSTSRSQRWHSPNHRRADARKLLDRVRQRKKD
jgi:hypothetical protein